MSASVAGSYTDAADQIGGDALDHAGQHLAGPALDDGGYTARFEGLHALDPAHRAGGLAHQGVADAVGVGLDGDVDVVDAPESAAWPA